MHGCGDRDETVLWSFMLSSVLTVTSPKTTKTQPLLLVGCDCRKYMFVDNTGKRQKKKQAESLERGK